MLQAQSGELDGQGQVEMVEPEQYSDIEVADNTYKIGHQVRIVNEPYYIYDNRNMMGRSGTVVRCAREQHNSSHNTTVYVLLDEFKACGPLIVVKGTPNMVCRCGEELQSQDMCSEWKVWKLPLPEH